MTVVRRTSMLVLAVLVPAATLSAVLIIGGCSTTPNNDTGYDWSASFSGWARQIHQLPDGGYILGGALRRLDSDFKLRWSAGCGGNSVLPTSDGGFLLTGEGSNGAGTWLYKTDSNGTMVWQFDAGLNHTNSGYDDCTCRTADGGYVTVGGDYDSLKAVIKLVKISPDGKEEWRASGDTGYGNWVVQTPDHGYLVANNWPARVCRFDSACTVVWSRSVRAIFNSLSYAYLAPDGECVLASSDFSSIMKLDTAGNVEWQRTYGQVFPKFSSVLPTSDGGYILAGVGLGTGSNDIALVKTDSLGTEEWSREFGEDDVYECGTWAEQTADGGYIVAGYAEYYNGLGWSWDTIRLKKTDANGNVAVAEPSTPQLTSLRTAFRVQPDPFSSFAAVPEHETERFILSDISGRKVGICNGNRIGEGLAPGVYFLSPAARPVIPRTRLLRIVRGG